MVGRGEDVIAHGDVIAVDPKDVALRPCVEHDVRTEAPVGRSVASLLPVRRRRIEQCPFGMPVREVRRGVGNESAER